MKQIIKKELTINGERFIVGYSTDDVHVYQNESPRDSSVKLWVRVTEGVMKISVISAMMKELHQTHPGYLGPI